MKDHKISLNKVIEIIKNHDWNDMAYCDDVERLIKKCKKIEKK